MSVKGHLGSKYLSRPSWPEYKDDRPRGHAIPTTSHVVGTIPGRGPMRRWASGRSPRACVCTLFIPSAPSLYDRIIMLITSSSCPSRHPSHADFAQTGRTQRTFSRNRKAIKLSIYLYFVQRSCEWRKRPPRPRQRLVWRRDNWSPSLSSLSPALLNNPTGLGGDAAGSPMCR